MNLVYGSWTVEELDQREREGTVYRPFQIGSSWYKVRELVVGPLGGKYQAEEVPPPISNSGVDRGTPPVATKQSVDTGGVERKGRSRASKAKEPTSAQTKEVFVAPSIRPWAIAKGLLPKPAKVGGRGGGVSYLPKEVRLAYREEFGPEALVQILRRDSQDARRLYAEEGDYPVEGAYRTPAKTDRKKLSAREIEEFNRSAPLEFSRARVKARDETDGPRPVKREAAEKVGRELIEPVIQKRREALEKAAQAKFSRTDYKP